MNIVVLNGSPNGNQSVSLQYFYYIRKHFSENVYSVFNVGLNTFDISEKKELKEKINDADLILWVFPVFFFNVPSQMKRFIETVIDTDLKPFFNGKYASCITSSIKISDVTAHQYIHVVSEFLGMNFIDGYSAERSDIFISKERKRLLDYATFLFNFVDEKIRNFPAYSFFQPAHNISKIENVFYPDKNVEIKGQTLLLYHSGISGGTPHKIIGAFQSFMKSVFHSVDLAEYGFKPCSGCFKCGYNNKCPINDGFVDFFNQYLKNTENLIFIIPAKDAFIASEWKAFFDRMFFNNHIMALKNVKITFVLYGSSLNKNLTCNLLEMFAVSQGGLLIDVLCLEDPERQIEEKIFELLRKIKLYKNINYQKPLSFYNIAFEKIIKSYVTLDLAPVFFADAKYYCCKFSVTNFFITFYMLFRNIFIGFLFLFPVFRKMFYNEINPYTIKRMTKIIERK